MSLDSIPIDMKSARACLVCSLIKVGISQVQQILNVYKYKEISSVTCSISMQRG